MKYFTLNTITTPFPSDEWINRITFLLKTARVQATGFTLSSNDLIFAGTILLMKILTDKGLKVMWAKFLKLGFFSSKLNSLYLCKLECNALIIMRKKVADVDEK